MTCSSGIITLRTVSVVLQYYYRINHRVFIALGRSATRLNHYYYTCARFSSYRVVLLTNRPTVVSLTRTRNPAISSRLSPGHGPPSNTAPAQIHRPCATVFIGLLIRSRFHAKCVVTRYTFSCYITFTSNGQCPLCTRGDIVVTRK